MVPRLRIAAWPMCGMASAISGACLAMSAERSASTWRVNAPISTYPFLTEIPDSPPMPLMSMRSFGADSRMLRVAIRLWPPASSRASAWPSNLIASSTDFALA